MLNCLSDFRISFLFLLNKKFTKPGNEISNFTIIHYNLVQLTKSCIPLVRITKWKSK